LRTHRECSQKQQRKQVKNLHDNFLDYEDIKKSLKNR
jgi:hypothetical protein